MKMWSRVGIVLGLIAWWGCSGESGGGDPPITIPSDRPSLELPDGTIAYAPIASRSAPSGRGGFAFGAASAATQIEDQNTTVDWWYWTQPPEQGGLGNNFPLGDASRGFTRALEDVELLRELGLDTYRFSVEWARVEPQRGVIDEEALAHYDRFVDALVAAGIRPMITLHHFSNPIWVDDFRQGGPCAEPTDDNLCGWGSDAGAPLIIEALAAHARLLAERFGDRVDEWCTLNEPVNYLLASYGIGYFPPGRNLLLTDFDRFVSVFRNYLAAHVAMYDAIKEADQIDATGDGVAASVGLTLSVGEWVPARRNQPSEDPEDIAAVARLKQVYHYLFPEALRRGAFDPSLDASWSEAQPGWEGKLDWLGVQYYFRSGVTGRNGVVPRLRLTPCFGDFDFGACLPPEDPTHWIPEMHYEFYAPGLYNVLVDFGQRWPDLPLTVTESGLATNTGARRAEHIVRSLEQIQRAINEGVDVRGYLHWTLMDNFEWAEGYGPRFGLYFVDFDGDFSRRATEGADVLREITGQRRLTPAMRARYGGLGPMTPEQ